MGLNYRDLDGRTRTLMLAEIERDIAEGKLYLSDNLNEEGRPSTRNSSGLQPGVEAT